MVSPLGQLGAEVRDKVGNRADRKKTNRDEKFKDTAECTCQKTRLSQTSPSKNTEASLEVTASHRLSCKVPSLRETSKLQVVTKNGFTVAMRYSTAVWGSVCMIVADIRYDACLI